MTEMPVFHLLPPIPERWKLRGHTSVWLTKLLTHLLQKKLVLRPKCNRNLRAEGRVAVRVGQHEPQLAQQRLRGGPLARRAPRGAGSFASRGCVGKEIVQQSF